MAKVRHVDYSAGDMISDIAGELTPAEFGVYWMICTLIYRRREPIMDDADWITGKFKRPGTDPRTVRAAIERLVLIKKVEREGGELMVSRCRDEVEKASRRIQVASENGSKGGRPRRDRDHEVNEINGHQEPAGFQPEKLTPAPAPAPTTSTNREESSLRSGPPEPTRADAIAAMLPEEQRATIKRATRLSPDWKPSEECRAFTVGLGLDPDAILPGFIDYWIACPGAKGLKLDWDATWRSWCRREAERGGLGQHGGGRVGYRQGSGSLIAAARAVGARLKNEH